MANAQQSMQSSPALGRKSAIRILAGMLLGSALLAPLAAAKGDEVVRAPSGIAYVTGGVGTEAVERLKGMEKNFNLKLVFASTTGAYLSDVKVTIVDAGGRVVLDTASEGPMLMAKLAAGGYQVNASFAGQTEQRRVTVGADRLSTVDFRWAAN